MTTNVTSRSGSKCILKVTADTLGVLYARKAGSDAHTQEIITLSVSDAKSEMILPRCNCDIGIIDICRSPNCMKKSSKNTEFLQSYLLITRWNIMPATKLSPFGRWHYQRYFLEWKCYDLQPHVTEFVAMGQIHGWHSTPPNRPAHNIAA